MIETIQSKSWLFDAAKGGGRLRDRRCRVHIDSYIANRPTPLEHAKFVNDKLCLGAYLCHSSI